MVYCLHLRSNLGLLVYNPFHKRGKRIMFLKSEIDAWLRDGKVKSEKDLEDEAARFIKSKRNNRF